MAAMGGVGPKICVDYTRCPGVGASEAPVGHRVVVRSCRAMALVPQRLREVNWRA